MNWQQIIGVAAFLLNVWGNLELTKVGNRGHIIRLCSNACWLVYSPLVGAWALMLNHATFAGINVLGYHRWKKAECEGRIANPKRAAELEKALRRLVFLGRDATYLSNGHVSQIVWNEALDEAERLLGKEGS